MNGIFWVGAAFLLAVVVFFLQARTAAHLKEQLNRLTAELALGQQQALASALGQMGQTIERFYEALAEFRQQVQRVQQQELEATRGTVAQQLSQLITAVNSQLHQTQTLLGERLEGASRVFGEVRGQLGQVAEMAARMENLGKEMQQLQDILKTPKLRGQFGETQLEILLGQVLPRGAWDSQYRFRDGQVVDAVIRLSRLVPVDAKFPLEAFQRLLQAKGENAEKQYRREFARTVKARVDEIAQKYIRPDEGTFDFALMFVPSENVYYEILVRGEGNDAIMTYATEKRVIPVSPNSFYAYLMTVALGLRGLQIEARAQEILRELSRLQTEFDKLADTIRLAGRHLTNAFNQFQEADKLTQRFGDRLAQAASGDFPRGPLPPGEPQS